MRNASMWWVMILIMLLIDLYIFIAVRSSLFGYSTHRNRVIFAGIYWLVTALSFSVILVVPRLPASGAGQLGRSVLFTIVFALFLAKLLAAVFFLVDDLRRVAQWAAGKLFSANNEVSEVSGADSDTISRSGFLTWLGIAAGGTLFSSLIYGFSNKYNYKIKRWRFPFPICRRPLRDLK